MNPTPTAMDTCFPSPRLRPGLCSITLRRYCVEGILRLMNRSGLESIEWGGDVHVPSTNIKVARDAGNRTRDAGLIVAAYGSYYRCESAFTEMESILKTAYALRAPIVRIWAGTFSSGAMDPARRQLVTEQLKAAAIAATDFGITLGLECHRDTLTDTVASALRLVEEVGLPNLRLYWQPGVYGKGGIDPGALRSILPFLAHVHCFHWGKGGIRERLPLSEGADSWRTALAQIRACSVASAHSVLLEYVKGDSEHQVLADAQTLRKLIASVETQE